MKETRRPTIKIARSGQKGDKSEKSKTNPENSDNISVRYSSLRDRSLLAYEATGVVNEERGEGVFGQRKTAGSEVIEDGEEKYTDIPLATRVRTTITYTRLKK